MRRGTVRSAPSELQSTRTTPTAIGALAGLGLGDALGMPTQSTRSEVDALLAEVAVD